jgi:hypothetical protein
MGQTDLRALKARLPRTWPAFFERHGSFSAAQAAALPVMLDGASVILCTHGQRQDRGGAGAADRAPLPAQSPARPALPAVYDAHAGAGE